MVKKDKSYMRESKVSVNSLVTRGLATIARVESGASTEEIEKY